MLNADAKEAVIIVQIETVSSPAADEISKKAAQSGLNLSGDSIDYKLIAQARCILGKYSHLSSI
ncbi:hypothetical protein [Paenibacillus piri]|uniref:Uncharacterized protein n=1 Tax=Paenibacillus piri TaxID=2547395 RepID=A0A4R5KBT1_9BACL|nr:hypothetical protein [Paenibacillus piri]TDF91978.1 hypothetical protein E1757_30970 [Paenibacillus piri]